MVEGPLRGFVVGKVLLDESGQLVLDPLRFPQPTGFGGFSIHRGLQAGRGRSRTKNWRHEDGMEWM